MKVNNKIELQNIAINHSADFVCNDFINIQKECTTEPYSFITFDTTLPASVPLRYMKNRFYLYRIEGK